MTSTRDHEPTMEGTDYAHRCDVCGAKPYEHAWWHGWDAIVDDPDTGDDVEAARIEIASRVVVRSPSGTPIERADDWVCVCGNRTDLSGFYPCNREGYEVEPTPLAWQDDLYCCDDCGRIIDGRNGQLVGQRSWS